MHTSIQERWKSYGLHIILQELAYGLKIKFLALFYFIICSVGLTI